MFLLYQFRAERAIVLTRRASFRRLAASCAAIACCTLAVTSGQPLARAADGRDLLANAIGSTRGSYLVYNFGPGHPAPAHMPPVSRRSTIADEPPPSSSTALSLPRPRNRSCMLSGV